ncbi:MAG: hypothetical protein WBA11_00615, partial [Rubrivirga sp.]
STWERAGRPPTDRPGAGLEVVPGVVRYDDVIPTPDTPLGAVDDLALYAGQSAGLVSSVVPARDVVLEVVREAEQVLSAWASR